MSDVRTIYVEGVPWRIFARRFADADAAREAVTSLVGETALHLGVYRTASNVVIVVGDVPAGVLWAAGMVEGETYLGLTPGEERSLVYRRMGMIEGLAPIAEATDSGVGVRIDHGRGIRLDERGHTVKSE